MGVNVWRELARLRKRRQQEAALKIELEQLAIVCQAWDDLMEAERKVELRRAA